MLAMCNIQEYLIIFVKFSASLLYIRQKDFIWAKIGNNIIIMIAVALKK